MPINPSASDILTEWKAAINILEQTAKYGRTNATNFLSLQNTLETAYAGDFLDEAEAAVQAARGALAGIVSQSFAQDIQRPFLKQYLKSVVGRGDIADDLGMLQEMYRYRQANGLYVQSRSITYGTPTAAAANVGNGQIIRLTKDRYNFNIENIFIDAKRALCIADYQTGTNLGEEVFVISGQLRPRDELERSGSGIDAVVAALSADNSLLSNPTWSSYTESGGSLTDITDWTCTPAVSASVYAIDSTNYFRLAPSDGTTGYSLKLVGSAKLTQKLSLRGTKLDVDTPYAVTFAWNAAIGSAVGTLTVRMGGVATTIVVNGQAGWQVSQVVSTPGQSNWYRLFAENDMDIEIEWTRTSGDLRIDDVILAPFSAHDNTFYQIIPKSATAYIPFRVNDEFNWADQANSDSIVQKWIWRAWNFYLPHSLGSSINWSDPT